MSISMTNYQKESLKKEIAFLELKEKDLMKDYPHSKAQEEVFFETYNKRLDLESILSEWEL